MLLRATAWPEGQAVPSISKRQSLPHDARTLGRRVVPTRSPARARHRKLRLRRRPALRAPRNRVILEPAQVVPAVCAPAQPDVHPKPSRRPPNKPKPNDARRQLRHQVPRRQIHPLLTHAKRGEHQTKGHPRATQRRKPPRRRRQPRARQQHHAQPNTNKHQNPPANRRGIHHANPFGPRHTPDAR